MKHDTKYVITLLGKPVRHIDRHPYWLQFSSFCRPYDTYGKARNDVRRQLRRYDRMQVKEPHLINLLDKWRKSLRIIPIRFS